MMRKIYFILVAVILVLRFTDLATTFVGVCRMGFIEINRSFINLSYRFGYISASIITMVTECVSFLFLAFIMEKFTSRFFPASKRYFSYLIPITMGIVFIFLGILPVANNSLNILNFHSEQITKMTIDVMNKSQTLVNDNDIENFNRTEFCRLV